MSLKKSEDVKYLVLSVREGFGFNCLKNLLLRFSPVFEDHRLVSDYVFAVAEPVFNLNFIWCTTEKHLKSLQQRRSNILIDIWATKSNQTWAAGYAVIGVQNAQILNPDVSLFYRRLPVRNIKVQFGVLPPEIFVTLNVQCNPFVSINSKVYLVNLTDAPNPKDRNSSQTGMARTAAAAKKRKIKAQKSHDRPPLLKQKNSDPSSNINSNQKQANKDTGGTAPKSPKINSKKIESSKRAKANTNPAKPNADSSTKPNADSSTKPNKDSSTTPHTEEENRKEVPFHQYQLEMHCGTVDWNATLKNVKISVRFCNPTDNSLAMAIENEDLNMLNVFLPQIICRMYYISIPDNLLKTVLCHPPQILISKAHTNQVITMGGVKVRHMQVDPKMEHFRSYISLTTKDKEIIGQISVTITFQDLGVISSLVALQPTNCISTFQQQDKAATGAEDIAKDFAKLLKIHEKLKATYSKIEAGFQKLTENHIPHHNFHYRSLTDPKSDNYVKVFDTDEFVDAMKQDSAAQQSDGAQKRVSFYVFPKHGESQKKAEEVKYRIHKGILKEANTNSETQLRAPSAAKFSNKDFNRNTHQLQIQHTLQEHTSKSSILIDPVDVLRNSNKETSESYAVHDKCDYLSTAQHVLTQSLLQTQHANTHLEVEYSKAVKELESLKENIPYTEMRRYVRTQDLKQEIDKFRSLSGLAIKIVDDDDQEEGSAEKDKKIETSHRKNRCEACNILSKTTNDSKSKQAQPAKGSKSSQGKKKKSYQPRISDTDIDEIRAQMDNIRTKLQLYLEKRDELIRIHQYPCGNPLVIYMTHTIMYLSTMWFNLRIELELLLSS